MITLTPETDTLLADMDSSAEHWAITDLARKLERERDEARQNAMTVGLERDKFTETIANLQRLNDNQRIQLVNLQNECALNNQTAQTWDRLSLEAELTQLRKVCDELAKQSNDAVRTMKTYGTANMGYSIDRLNTALTNYSTLPHVIKAKGMK